MIAAITFYGIVLTAHIAANLIAFGVVCAWPLLPSGTTAVHHARGRILGKFVSYAAVVALGAGIYLATDASAWSHLWVQVPLGIYVILMGIIGAVMTRGERHLARYATDGQQPDTDQYASQLRIVNGAAFTCWLLIAAAVLIMTTKPSF